ncbi:RNA chaperone Hfq [Brevibacillus sp. B_LB10_24]|uniref:RNA chaperone Hfq n=1 Tax=Brevibacillus sp. B_LB10_24 TaxID=3380645 RepID=UPI0038BDC887
MIALKKIAVQEIFLEYVISHQVPVALITKNGVHMKGFIIATDPYTITLQIDSKQSLLYKAAISTIVPAKPVPLHFGNSSE